MSLMERTMSSSVSPETTRTPAPSEFNPSHEPTEREVVHRLLVIRLHSSQTTFPSSGSQTSVLWFLPSPRVARLLTCVGDEIEGVVCAFYDYGVI